jgi:hypothetical protein
MHPTVLTALARENQNDVRRDADQRRLAHLATTHADDRDPSPALAAARRGRNRLGLLLVAAGTRLTHAPHQPC